MHSVVAEWLKWQEVTRQNTFQNDHLTLVEEFECPKHPGSYVVVGILKIGPK